MQENLDIFPTYLKGTRKTMNRPILPHSSFRSEIGVKSANHHGKDCCNLESFNWMEMTIRQRANLIRELPFWHHWYLPIPHDSTVLDIGAGCGDTALFYLLHGAQRVICVESDPESIGHLKKNFGNDPRVSIIQAHVDHVKLDIEGSEEGMAMETHFPAKFRKMSNPNRKGVYVWRIDRR